MRFLMTSFGKLDRISEDSTFIANAVKTLCDHQHLTEIIAEEQRNCSDKLKNMVESLRDLHVTANMTIEATNVCARKLAVVENSFVDLEVSQLQSSVILPPSEPFTPAVDSLKRDITSIKDDAQICLSAVRATSDLINQFQAKLSSNQQVKKDSVSQTELIDAAPLESSTANVCCQIDDVLHAAEPTTIKKTTKPKQKKKKNGSRRPGQSGSGRDVVPAQTNLTFSPTSTIPPPQPLFPSSSFPPSLPVTDTSFQQPSQLPCLHDPLQGSSSHYPPSPPVPDTHQHQQYRPSVGQNSALQQVNAVDAATGFRCSLKAVEQPKILFVSRLHADTSESEVLDNIIRILESVQTSVDRSSISCRKIVPRMRGNSIVSSFKIVLPASFFEIISCSDFWPTNAIVREFSPIMPRELTSLPKNRLVQPRSSTGT